jgi:UDP-GlcNAc:undecaprenyl-phosphate GlcNAc-1-phosphate transferase
MTALLTALAAAAVSFAATPLSRRLARAIGLIDHPVANHQGKTHTKSTPLLGGLAVAIGFFTAAYLFGSPLLSPALLTGGIAMVLLGAADDRWGLDYRVRLGVQSIAALGFVSTTGVVTPEMPYAVVWLLLLVVWMVWTTNSVNLMDNLDGTTGGSLAIGAFILSLSAWFTGHLDFAVLYAAVAGACVGFLPFNIRNASIFLGDAGTLFLGFTISSLIVLNVRTVGLSVWRLAAFSAFVAMPIYDATFATLRRISFGRPIFMADGSNITFRFRAKSFGKTQILILEYGVAALGALGACAMVVTSSPTWRIVVAFALAVLAIALGTYLWGEERVDWRQTRSAGGDFSRNLIAQFLSLDTLVDFVVIVLSYGIAYGLRYNWAWPIDMREGFLGALPIIVICHYASFYYVGIYSRLWEYASVRDLIQLAQAVVFGCMLSIFATASLYRLSGLSRSVFFVAALLLLFLTAATRLSRRALLHLAPALSAGSERAMIFGAGRAGDLLYREILHNPGLGLRVVGFVDDDPSKCARRFHGLPVIDGAALAALNGQIAPSQILVSTEKVTSERLSGLKAVARTRGWRLRTMKIELTAVDLSLENE